LVVSHSLLVLILFAMDSIHICPPKKKEYGKGIVGILYKYKLS
jgi:hypothetical protein